MKTNFIIKAKICGNVHLKLIELQSQLWNVHFIVLINTTLATFLLDFSVIVLLPSEFISFPMLYLFIFVPFWLLFIHTHTRCMSELFSGRMKNKPAFALDILIYGESKQARLSLLFFLIRLVMRKVHHTANYGLHVVYVESSTNRINWVYYEHTIYGNFVDIFRRMFAQ